MPVEQPRSSSVADELENMVIKNTTGKLQLVKYFTRGRTSIFPSSSSVSSLLQVIARTDAKIRLVLHASWRRPAGVGCRFPDALGSLSHTFEAQRLSEARAGFLPPSCVCSTAGRVERSNKWEQKLGKENGKE